MKPLLLAGDGTGRVRAIRTTDEFPGVDCILFDRWADGAETAHNTLSTTESATGILASGTDVRIHNTTLDGGVSGISTGGNTDAPSSRT